MDHGLLCPHCQARYRKAYNLGDELTCKSCGETFVAGDVAGKATTETLCGDAYIEMKLDARTGKNTTREGKRK